MRGGWHARERNHAPIMRLIAQLADFIARIAGHTKRRDYAAALAEADRAWNELLAVPRDLVDRVDGPTLAGLLREPSKMRVGAQLLIEEASSEPSMARHRPRPKLVGSWSSPVGLAVGNCPRVRLQMLQ